MKDIDQVIQGLTLLSTLDSKGEVNPADIGIFAGPEHAKTPPDVKKQLQQLGWEYNQDIKRWFWLA